MCGPISQHKGPYEYFPESGPLMPDLFKLDRPGATYNVAPGSRPIVLHCLDGETQLTRWFWQYLPLWAEKGSIGCGQCPPE